MPAGCVLSAMVVPRHRLWGQRWKDRPSEKVAQAPSEPLSSAEKASLGSLISSSLLCVKTVTRGGSGRLTMEAAERSLRQGELGSALASAITRIIADFTGRGPTRSRAFLHGDVVVCLLEDGATKAEQNLIASGREIAVRELRDSVQRATEHELVDAVEALTGRRVLTFLSGTSTGADSQVEVFVLEPESTDGTARRR